MGPTLNIASAKNAYTLTDRGTWLNFKNRGELAILVQGDPVLFNQYAVMLISPQKHPHVKQAPAKKVADWLISPKGRRPSPTTSSTANRCSSPTPGPAKVPRPGARQPP